MKQTSMHFQPAHLSEAAVNASRQMWLASLGAAVVTRDWVQNEAGTVLKTLVKEGTAVESRAIRFVGDQVEHSVSRANTLWRRTRHTVETTVRAYADTAVTIVRETLGNQVLAGALGEVAEHVKTGRGLADPLLEAGSFPKLAVQMIRVGEETGQLQEMLIQVADTYDGEVQIAVKRLLTLLEPALILGLGVIIAGIIMSILVAILSLNELAF
jgi:hypothetical protein